MKDGLKEDLAVQSKKSSSEFQIREIKDQDAEKAAELIARLKKLNGEFDPLLKTSEKIESDSLRILKETVRGKDHIVLVALSGSRLVAL